MLGFSLAILRTLRLAKLNPSIYTKFKVRNPVSNPHNCVYVIVCKACNSKLQKIPAVLYVGHTARLPKSRLHSHLQDNNSPIFRHKLNNDGHSDFVIIPIFYVPDVNLRVYYEALTIDLLKPCANAYDSAPLLLFSSKLPTQANNDIIKYIYKLVIKGLSGKKPFPAKTDSLARPPVVSQPIPLRRSRRLADRAQSL